MTRRIAIYLQKLFSLAGASWFLAGSTVGNALAAIPPDTTTNNVLPPTDPLIFERPHSNSRPGQYAGHSSHASHASHSSHYSGSGGGYDASPAPYIPPPPVTAAPQRAAPAVPAAQDKMVMVMRVQAKLHDLGYYTGTIDGTLGSSTQDALRRYQLVKGFSATGRMDEATLISLGIFY